MMNLVKYCQTPTFAIMQLNIGMTRRPTFTAGEYYHISQIGAEMQPIFLDNEDRRRFVRLLYACNTEERISVRSIGVTTVFEYERSKPLTDVGAYSIIDDQFHLLLREQREGGISAFMQKLMTAYTMYFNAKYNRRGRLFAGPYQARHIQTQSQLKVTITFIHIRPALEHTEHPARAPRQTEQYLDEYQYSSYHDYQGRERDEASVINQEALPKRFARRISFERLLNEWRNQQGKTFDSREY